MAFAAGLAVGVVACRLVMGRGRSIGPVAPAAVAQPESTVPEPAQQATASIEEEQEPQPAGTSAESGATVESEDPAVAVDDVVAELERRVKGRRTEGKADRSTGSGRGRRPSD